jgi:hypothetical protein
MQNSSSWPRSFKNAEIRRMLLHRLQRRRRCGSGEASAWTGGRRLRLRNPLTMGVSLGSGVNRGGAGVRSCRRGAALAARSHKSNVTESNGAKYARREGKTKVCTGEGRCSAPTHASASAARASPACWLPPIRNMHHKSVGIRGPEKSSTKVEFDFELRFLGEGCSQSHLPRS